MLNFLHISDFRIDAPQAFMLPDAAERRKQDLMNCFINFCEKVCEIKPDAIFISGNLIDSPDSHPAVILEIADILNNISLSSKIHIFMVTGSRDTPIGRPNKEKFLSTFSRNPFIHVFSNSQNFSSITVKSKNHIQFTVYGKSYESPPKNITSKIPIHNNIVDPAILLVPAIPRKIKETKFYKNLSNLDPDICLKNNFSFLALGGLENRFFSNSEEMSWCIPGSPERITLSGDGGLGSIIKVTLTPTHKKWNVSFHEIKINTIKTVNIIINMDLSVFSIEEKIK
jgi:DNA repair exonuclease SbcCD nuclease subunit